MSRRTPPTQLIKSVAPCANTPGSAKRMSEPSLISFLVPTYTYRTICVKLISGAASANQDDGGHGHGHGPTPTREWDLRSLPMPRDQLQIPRPSAGTDQVDFGIRAR